MESFCRASWRAFVELRVELAEFTKPVKPVEPAEPVKLSKAPCRALCTFCEISSAELYIGIILPNLKIYRQK